MGCGCSFEIFWFSSKQQVPKTFVQEIGDAFSYSCPKRVSEIARLDKNLMQIISQGITFYLPGLSKTQKDCKSREIFYANY